jgi:hypothetical protein
VQQHHYGMHAHSQLNGRTKMDLRTRTADFFKMEVPRARADGPPKDTQPLRRTLKTMHDLDSPSNAMSCFALWQLMERNQAN